MNKIIRKNKIEKVILTNCEDEYLLEYSVNGKRIINTVDIGTYHDLRILLREILDEVYGRGRWVIVSSKTNERILLPLLRRGII